jgi:type I restriction enzyme S subunit
VELFGDKYAEKALIDLCNIIDYRGKTPEKAENGLPFITAKNVKMHYMSLEPREYISKDTYDKVMVRGFPQEGDVVFTTEAPLGNVCRIPHFDTEFYIGQRIVTLQTTALNPTYLEYALSTEEFIKKYMGKSSGSTVTGIRVRLLEQLTIPVPPRSLQDRFAKYVEQADRSKLTVQQGLDKLELLKQSLMQKYFG